MTRLRTRLPVLLATLILPACAARQSVLQPTREPEPTTPPAAVPERAAQPLPPAADLIARYQQAIGGKEIFAAKRAIHATGDFTVPAAGVTGSFEMFSARPNRSLMRVTMGGFGEIRSGFDGTVAWSMNPMEGPRVMQDREKAQAADNAEFESVLRDVSYFKSVETVERTTVAGRDCYKVRLVWKSDRETFDCYSPETGLLVASMGEHQSSMGAVETVTLYDDYREFEGVKVATKVSVQLMGMEQVLTMREFRFTDVPASTFELPAEIRALVR
jgi:hypothetical protein